MMSSKLMLLAMMALVPASSAAEQGMNPIRKVVTMLQAMQEKVSAEGEKESELYERYMCYCKNGAKSLSDGIAANEEKSGTLASDIKQAEEEKAVTKDKLEEAQNNRAAAKTAMAEATAIREKEAAAYAAQRATYDSNLFALVGKCNVAKPGGEWTKAECPKMGGKWVGAIPALEASMGDTNFKVFLQTDGAQVLRKLVQSKADMLDADRHDLLAFLSGGQGSEYVPQSQEIVGILKQIADEMGAGLAEATAAEDAALSSYASLMAAKTKEVNALTASIEKKLTKVGELSVSITQMKNELGDTAEALIADKEFLENLDKDCATKTAEWEVIVKTRAEELVALAETIKILNDDDSLELFKKTLPSAASSFMQVQQGAEALRERALVALQGAPRSDRARIDFIGLAIRGKKIGFDKVIQMIDEMVATLKKEQVEDDNKKLYCATQFDESDDKKKSLEKSLSDTEADIASTEEGIATTADEIAALTASIKALDKSVAEATEQRKNEHDDYKELMASDSAAKELLGFAKNRLNKFYNPKLYKAPPKVELSKEDRIFVSEGGTPPPTAAAGGIAGTGITVLADVSAHVAPPPPPEAPGAYKKKSGENSGVMAMIDLLVQDLDKEMTESTAAEKDSQADYEQLMADSAAKRTSDSALLTQKTATKASLEGDLQAHKENHADLTRDLGATLKYISELHAECDWLLKFFEIRKEARASEVDALGKAKAVLSGADYALLQTRSHSLLRGSTRRACPSTELSSSNSANAAGTQVFDHKAIPDNTCVLVGGKVNTLKFCGPGELQISRMTCSDRHEYKSETISHPSSAWTKGQCEDISLANTVADGALGSYTLDC